MYVLLCSSLTPIVNSKPYIHLLCSDRRDEHGRDEGKGREEDRKEQPAMKKYEEPKAPVSLIYCFLIMNITCEWEIRARNPYSEFPYEK